MEVVLKELARDSVIKDRVLRKRARDCARISFTKHYVVFSDEKEIAYLAIDHMPGTDYLLLYEIFIKKEYRNKGIGSRVLARVESIAGELGYSKVALHAESFDKDIPKKSIENWYIKRGYSPSESLEKALEKIL
ncbi:MAG: GNAT family N-acetyltransferase [Deltaproteobacteria bacterium]|nr:GNAT family N-acetyltransferase [Deltaproteobacteria bacterium]